jgi:hypothetical protein
MTYIVQKDEFGNPIRAIGLGSNITAEKKSEECYEREMGNLKDINDNNLIAKGHFNLTKDVVLEYATKNDTFIKIKPGTKYSQATKTFANMAYQRKEKKTIADKLDRINLLKRFQNGQMADSLVYRRRIEGHLPIWISMSIRTFIMPETGNIELFSYAYDITDKMENDELMSLISETDFDYVAYIFVDTKQFEFIKKNKSINFANPRETVFSPFEQD